MPSAYFPSLPEAEVIDVIFERPSGSEAAYRLLVDSGFVGLSCFVLPKRASDLAQGAVVEAQTIGALHGTQNRILVACSVPSLALRFRALAILADTATLSLPAGVDGLAGLTFLRQFRRGGSEQMEDGTWRFFLETATT